MPSLTFAKGFTLIELLVGIVIMAVILGLGAANYRSFYRRQQLKQVAEAIKADMRFAQSQAYAGVYPTSSCAPNVFLGWVFNPQGATGYEIRIRCIQNGNGSQSNGTVIAKTVRFPSGIVFFSNGSASPNGVCHIYRPISQDIVACDVNGITPLQGDLTIVIKDTNTSDTQAITVTKSGAIL